jgi:hypothetical protein
MVSAHGRWTVLEGPVPAVRGARPAAPHGATSHVVLPGVPRAAYEERRAADRGAIAVQMVDRVRVSEHDLSECVARVISSPSASRRLLQAMTALVRDGVLSGHPRRSATHTAAVRLGESVARNRRN